MIQELHARYTSLKTGSVYHNRGGSDYVCLSAGETCAHLMNVYSGWTLIAMGIVQYENGWIEWDWSKGLTFDKQLLSEYKETGRLPQRG